MKVVSVINYKGGVGKTTLVSNLAAYAASQGKRVLMIDLDTQMSLTLSFMNMDTWEKFYANTPNKTLKDFFSAVLEGETPPDLSELVENIGQFGEDGRFDLLISYRDLNDIDVALIESIASSKPEVFARKFLKCYNQLRIALAKIADNYDLVLIDCPPNFYALVKNAVTASDYCIIPSKMDYLSTLGVEHLQNNLKKYIKEYADHLDTYNKNKPREAPEYQPVFTEILGVVPTMVNVIDNKRKRLVTIENDYINYLPEQGFHIFPWIRNNPMIFGSVPSGGVPVVISCPKLTSFITWRNTIRPELQELGQEFIERAEI